ncbi:hypothetical protein F183_A47460 [Bryobacterales bacterium F-183]|nr:hypothetical protein F183_A47460 [Bryobacterales bacterium F-183]
MPLYEYKCESCSKHFEVIQKFSDAPLEVHAECGKGPVTRLISPPALQFKGSGFYITDYKGGSAKPSSSPSNAPASSSSSDSGSASSSPSSGSSSSSTDTK